ncbi:MAG TPA: VOC family protein [Candidatus Krumholzibacteria bacterium]|nr:VOC family protein [Candidatus Krumholzibacteria bacterium]
MATKPIPDGYHTVTPYLIVKGASRALEFYKKAFGAEQLLRMDGPGGSVMHAEVKIGDSRVMLADEFPEMGYVAPQSAAGNSLSLHLYVEDVDARFKRAIDAGGKVKRDVRDEFYGDRTGTLADPFGHVWTLSSHKEDVPEAELRRRMEEMSKKSGT